MGFRVGLLIVLLAGVGAWGGAVSTNEVSSIDAAPTAEGGWRLAFFFFRFTLIDVRLQEYLPSFVFGFVLIRA